MSCVAGVFCLIRGWATPALADLYLADARLIYPAILTVIGILFSAFGGGTMTLMWTYLAESFPTRIRSNATGIVFASARFIAVPVTLTIPATYAAIGYVGINVVNALWYFIPAAFALIWGINSAQKSLEELEIEAEKMTC